MGDNGISPLYRQLAGNMDEAIRQQPYAMRGTGRPRDAGGKTARRSSRRAACVALCALLLAACSPTYNWREVLIADGAARATFPDRPATDTRDIRLGGRDLRFSLTSARVGDAVFAVGYAPLPPALAADPAGQRELADALVRALYANLGAEPPATPPAYGTDIEVRGHAGGRPVWALGRVWVQGGLLVEAVATGSEKGLPAAPAREFVGSLRFAQ
ncbi:hypothetical protein [Bordetella genomosp. 11]|uniref:hypothetical protein n=1 Tax=Bordetella genomosp. 11 TaxID=1416808 RepID=UPI0020CE89A2|nr:hypothetical protein [Bordetella genomosp. 11]